MSTASVGDVDTTEEYYYSHDIVYDEEECEDWEGTLKPILDIAMAWAEPVNAVLYSVLGNISSDEKQYMTNIFTMSEHDDVTTCKIARIYHPDNIYADDGWINYSLAYQDKENVTLKVKRWYKDTKLPDETKDLGLVYKAWASAFADEDLLEEEAEQCYQERLDEAESVKVFNYTPQLPGYIHTYYI